MEAHDKGLVCAEALIAGHVQRLQTTQPAKLGSRWATSGLVSDQWGGASASPHFFSNAVGQCVGGRFAGIGLSRRIPWSLFILPYLWSPCRNKKMSSGPASTTM